MPLLSPFHSHWNQMNLIKAFLLFRKKTFWIDSDPNVQVCLCRGFKGSFQSNWSYLKEKLPSNNSEPFLVREVSSCD